jgi:hypothetical protein
MKTGMSLELSGLSNLLLDVESNATMYNPTYDMHHFVFELNHMTIKETVNKMLPIWTSFFASFGYSNEKAERFANGYASAVLALPKGDQKKACEGHNHECLIKAINFAEIDLVEALERIYHPND